MNAANRTPPVVAAVMTLLDALPDGLLIVDPSGSIRQAHAEAETIFGYGPGAMEGSR